MILTREQMESMQHPNHATEILAVPNNDIRQLIRVQVLGKSFPMRHSALDLFKPQHQSYTQSAFECNFTQDYLATPNVKHRDIVTTWRSMSIPQAHELLFWEDAFKWCLEKHVEEELIKKFYSSNIRISKSNCTALCLMPWCSLGMSCFPYYINKPASVLRLTRFFNQTISREQQDWVSSMTLCLNLVLRNGLSITILSLTIW
jgi:hypothetical protein